MSEKSEKSTSFDELMAKFIASKQNTMQAIVEMEEKVEKIKDEIELLEDSCTGEICAVVVAILAAKVDCKLEFQLTYLVTGVTWKPYYDLHGATVDGKPSLDISLHYCANITQNTGEDWNDTILTLSTANSQALHNSTIPKVDPIQDASDDWSLKEEMVTNSIMLDKNPISLSYRVDRRVSLPSERSTHKMSIAVMDFSGALKYVCVPQKTNAVFMEGQMQNTSPYELLAGQVNVFIDNSFATKTEMAHIGSNETFTCMLVIDPSLKVSYQSEFRTVHEPKRNFTEPFKTTTRTVTTTITNGHSFDVTELVVRDAIPLGNDETNIKVALRRPDGLAQAKDDEEVAVALHGSGEARDSEKQGAARVRWVWTEKGDGGEKEGLYEWVCQIKAGKKIRLQAEWEVKAPGDAQWEER
ncbi:hypothetical protein GSI_05625 [Ganoderma sinense ZZ0214-1]|uniref:DUF4139 domain-containing protein n=1 Tax=Ganoderma sinense ZZ0214-1 TaxID=1077348 RepID=A0A2G8SF37_9APHY|nr:hypothetical protein GSI_05625 [Ganoderma sinense ZZ0214-1]